MRLVKIGIRLPNKTVLPAPKIPIALFQMKKQMTEAPMPRYNIEITTFSFQMIAGTCCTSHKKNGIIRIVPRVKLVNRKLTGEMDAGLFLTIVLYTAKQKAPNNIQASTEENFR